MSNTQSMLEEQKMLNMQLMAQMKMMQQKMNMMDSGMGGGNYNMANNGMGGGNGGGIGFREMGMGYGGGNGGGKMGSGPRNMGPAGGGTNSTMPYNMRIPQSFGDWDCPNCGNMNFKKRFRCNGRANVNDEEGTCQTEKRPEYIRKGTEGGPKNCQPGDWECSKCGNMNFARRTTCNRCQGDRKDVGGLGYGDWICGNCDYTNSARSGACGKCKADRSLRRSIVGDPGRMGGNGGPGMMERMGGQGMMGGPGMGGGRGGLGMSGGMGGLGMMGGMGRQGMNGVNREAREQMISPGDWDCPKCGHMNFKRRDKCTGYFQNKKCGLKKPEFEEYRVSSFNNRNVKEPGDWYCYRCGNVNFKFRMHCNKCKLDKSEAMDDKFNKSEVMDDKFGKSEAMDDKFNKSEAMDDKFNKSEAMDDKFRGETAKQEGSFGVGEEIGQ